jgi:hypothetical protein
MSTRTATGADRATASSVGRSVVLLVALAGLFAMHGLSGHGAMDHDGSAFRVPGDTTMAAMHAAPVPVVDQAVDHTLGQAPGHAVSRAVGPATGRTTDAAMGLCLAVLTGALVLLLLRRAAWPVAAEGRRVLRHCALLARARAPDPPDLLALCVHRC